MKFLRTLLLTSTILGLAACGAADLTCDDPSPYQLAASGARIQAPPGLDNLDSLKEIPLPEASPAQARATGSPCLELPPIVLSGSN